MRALQLSALAGAGVMSQQGQTALGRSLQLKGPFFPSSRVIPAF